MDIYPYIIHRFIHLLSGWPRPAADSYPLAMEHLESRIATRVHSSARPSMVSFLPNPANHKRIRLNRLFHLFWRATSADVLIGNRRDLLVGQGSTLRLNMMTCCSLFLVAVSIGTGFLLIPYERTVVESRVDTLTLL
jgi:hypothetical protein